MLRSARLIKKELRWSAEIMPVCYAVRKGDQMTGFEIMASLSLEEQQTLNTEWVQDLMFKGTSSMFEGLSRLYTWNGKGWER